MTQRLFPRAWWFSAVLYLTVSFYLLFQGGKTSLMLFMIVNALAVYLMLGRWSGIAGVQGTRAIERGGGESSLLTAGMRLQVKLRLQIPGFWPLTYIIVREKLVRSGSEEAQQYEMSFVPDFKRRGEVQFETAPLRRGRYEFQTTECLTSDIFGLFEHRGSFEQPFQIQVMPRLIELKDWGLFKRSQRGLYQHSFTSLWSRETTQIDGVRDYIHGDRLSRIHWNATAKTGQWKSKEFEREALPRVVFLLDRLEGSYGTAEDFELAVSVAGSLLELTIARGMPIGFISCGESAYWFGEGRIPAERDEVLQHLVDVEPDGSQSLVEVLGGAAERFESGIHLVIISPSMNEETLQGMNALESNRMVPSFVHIASRQPDDSEAAKLRQWQRISQSNHWEFSSISQLEQLPQLIGGVSA